MKCKYCNEEIKRNHVIICMSNYVIHQDCNHPDGIPGTKIKNYEDRSKGAFMHGKMGVYSL